MTGLNAPLTCCIRSYPYTEAIKNGSITLPGVNLDFVDVKPHIAAFRRMVRDLEFDICELAPTTYMIARAHGVPIVALPVFFVRRFHHTGWVVRPDAEIDSPKDLEGKKVGVRAWSVTTGVWKRGILQNEFGVDLDKVTWVVDDEEHVSAMKLPANVVHVDKSQSLADMIATGELQAGLAGDAGIGRKGAPTAGWNEAAPILPPDLRELIPNGAALQKDFYNRTGIFPMHGTLVIKEALLKDRPTLARDLYDAFVAAKAPYLEALRSGQANGKTADDDRKLAELVGDPIPYGLEANRTSIEALITYAYQQKLIPHAAKAEDYFLSL